MKPPGELVVVGMATAMTLRDPNHWNLDIEALRLQAVSGGRDGMTSLEYFNGDKSRGSSPGFVPGGGL